MAENEKTKGSEKRSSQANADSIDKVTSSDAATLSPPTFQLKAEASNIFGENESSLSSLDIASGSAQMKKEEEEEQIQMKNEDEEEQLQMKKGPIQQKEDPASSGGDVMSKMESSFGTSFSDVNIHKESSKASDVGALAYTQGSDIHFAPGQFKPETNSGQQLLGHELTHVVQQREGRVSPTTEVNGMPVNDNKGLEAEADQMGAKAAQGKFIGSSGSLSMNSKTSQLKANSSQNATIQKFDVELPWDSLKKKGRNGMALEISNTINLIREQKVNITDTWGKNADKEDLKPGKVLLELSLGILAAGLGGVLGHFVGQAAKQLASSEAVQEAIKGVGGHVVGQMLNGGKGALTNVITGGSVEKATNAQHGLDNSSKTGLKDYYVESSKNMYLSDQKADHSRFTDRMEAMTEDQLAIMLYLFNLTFSAIQSDHSRFNQQLTVGFMSLQDNVFMSDKAGVKEGDSADTVKEKIEKFQDSDGTVNETDARAGKLLLFGGATHNIGSWKNPKPKIGTAIGSELNNDTLAHLKGAKVSDLPFSLSFRFWGPGSTKVWFTKAANNTIYVDLDESWEFDSNGWNGGREWLARLGLNTDRDLSRSEINSNCAKGARKVYDMVKGMSIPKPSHMDLF